jgi:hypothetical protein
VKRSRRLRKRRARVKIRGFEKRQDVIGLRPDSCIATRLSLVQNESTPTTGALPNFIRSGPQAATFVGLTSRTLLELVIGIARGFIASGISRTRSMCRSPFSRLAPLT